MEMSKAQKSIYPESLLFISFFPFNQNCVASYKRMKKRCWHKTHQGNIY